MGEESEVLERKGILETRYIGMYLKVVPSRDLNPGQLARRADQLSHQGAMKLNFNGG